MNRGQSEISKIRASSRELEIRLASRLADHALYLSAGNYYDSAESACRAAIAGTTPTAVPGCA